MLPDEGRVTVLAQLFRPLLNPPLVIYLQGDLGAGKTTFARALIQAMGYPNRVKSPSYGLLESYRIDPLHFLHLDLYRIGDPAELEYLAIRDQLDGNCVLLAEWPEKGAGFLPEPDLVMHFKEVPESRFVQLISRSEAGERLSLAVRQSSENSHST